MNLIDTHCHIQSIGLDKGERTTRSLWAKSPELSVSSVIADAKAAGVNQMICVGCDLEDSVLATDFVNHHQGTFASIGLHPHEADIYSGDSEKLSKFSELIGRPKVVAIGECGLDYYYNHSAKENQIAILKFQIELALSSGLPIIFHVRDAYDDFWPVFESYKNIQGVLHSYTDSTQNLARALKNGLYIGVNGIATFAKMPEQLSMYQAIPLDRLVLETDAPFLTPVPFRGKICQPKYIEQTANFLSTLRHEDLEVLAQATTNNAKKLFNLGLG
jgi:TatD DNase family protein